MKIKSKHILIFILVFILMIPILKPYIRDKFIYWRIQKARSFPSKGYTDSHPSLSANVFITIEKDSKINEAKFANGSQKVANLKRKLQVNLVNIGDTELKSLIAAFKINPKANNFYQSEIPLDVMYKPTDLEPQAKNSDSNYTYTNTIELKSMTQEEIENFKKLLSEPVFLKVVHNNGTELLEVKPIVVMSYK